MAPAAGDRGASVSKLIAKRVWSETHERSEIVEWGVEEVVMWLTSVLPNNAATLNVFEKFRENMVNGAVLLSLTEGDLEKNLMISNFGARRMIWLALMSLDSFGSFNEDVGISSIGTRSRSPEPRAPAPLSPARLVANTRRLFENLPHVHFTRIWHSSNFCILFTLVGFILLISLPMYGKLQINPWFSLWMLLPVYSATNLTVQRITRT